MMVGGMAESRRRLAETTALGKYGLNMAMPAGFGALAMTVNPPPATAPPTKANLNSNDVPLTNDPRYVSAALSVIAVSVRLP